MVPSRGRGRGRGFYLESKSGDGRASDRMRSLIAKACLMDGRRFSSVLLSPCQRADRPGGEAAEETDEMQVSERGNGECMVSFSQHARALVADDVCISSSIQTVGIKHRRNVWLTSLANYLPYLTGSSHMSPPSLCLHPIVDDASVPAPL
nr:hypothetical protein CFP56_68756 [Quercus suber]